MPTPVPAISGIGPSTADLLSNHGFKTAESIAKTTVEKLSLVPGFGEIRSANTIKAAAEAIGAETTKSEPEAEKPKAKPKKEKSGKDKKNKDKKDKKKNKKKKNKKGKKKDKKKK